MLAAGCTTVERAHPRIRGEHPRDVDRLMDALGSSPHPRGALSAGDPPHHHGRLIPASAGSTSRG